MTRRLAGLPPALVIAPLVLLVVLCLPLLGLEVYWQRQVVLIAIYTLLCSGLNLSFGYAGELALGQVAVFAAGAYLTAILHAHGQTDLLVAMALSMAFAGFVGLISGAPGVRLGHWSLAIASFFLLLLIPSFTSIFEEETGGALGLAGVLGPTIAGQEVDDTTFYVIAVVAAFLWLLVFRNLINSRIGTGLRALKASPALAASLGAPVVRLKLQAYVIGALPAGIAGCFYAYLAGFVSPESFELSLLITILAATVVGGASSVWGAPIGAAILVIGPLQAAAGAGYSIPIYGAFLVIVGALFSGGIAGFLTEGIRRLRRARTVRQAAMRDSDATELAVAPTFGSRIDGQALRVSDVSKAFAGVHALEGVDAEVQAGRITAIIGPNGAGKTTLLNAICGLITPDTGEMSLGDERLTGLPPHERARLGLGRTFQTPVVPEDLTVREVVASGCLSIGRVGVLSAMFRLPSMVRAQRADEEATTAAMTFTGLTPIADEVATSLPLGTRRVLEVARAIAGRPRVLLLDEPAAGLDDEGLRVLGDLLRSVRDAGGTVVIIEHNVPFVMGLADAVVAMDLGTVISVGTPAEVSADERVLDVYLGRRGKQRKTDDAGDPLSTSESSPL